MNSFFSSSGLGLGYGLGLVLGLRLGGKHSFRDTQIQIQVKKGLDYCFCSLVLGSNLGFFVFGL